MVCQSYFEIGSRQVEINHYREFNWIYIRPTGQIPQITAEPCSDDYKEGLEFALKPRYRRQRPRLRHQKKRSPETPTTNKTMPSGSFISGQNIAATGASKRNKDPLVRILGLETPFLSILKNQAETGSE